LRKWFAGQCSQAATGVQQKKAGISASPKTIATPVAGRNSQQRPLDRIPTDFFVGFVLASCADFGYKVEKLPKYSGGNTNMQWGFCSPATVFSAVVACLLSAGSMLRSDDQDQLRVGLQADGRILVPTNQILKPAGKQITFPGRPVDITFTDDGTTLVVKNLRSLVFLDANTGTVKQTLNMIRPAKKDSKLGFSVVGLFAQGPRVYVSDTKNQVRVAMRGDDGKYHWIESIDVAGPQVGGLAHPAGITSPSPDELMFTSTRGNNVQQVDLKTGKVTQVIPVGVAPYMICCTGPDRCYVSNWGGDPPRKTDPQMTTSGTPVRIDPATGVASQGTVSVLARVDGKWRQQKTITVGLHPCGMIWNPRAKILFVANANSDTVSVIDTQTDSVVETIDCRPKSSLPFGSGSNAVALSPDGGRIYVANGTNNCIAVIQLGGLASAMNRRAGLRERPEKSRLIGLIPTGWYPGAILVSADGKRLFVANIKGHGSLSQPRPAEKGKNSYDALGSVSIIDVPSKRPIDPSGLAEYTAQVHANNRLAYSLTGLDKPRADAPPVPVPQRHGEPSVFKHVVYIIKENRTYDQVLGDMKEGNGDPNLALFGEEVTPNHHALAREFTLFDNFYCSGVLSADGHSWTDEAYVTDYLERAFGGWVRSYPMDDEDPIAYAPTGFIWDNALAHKRTIRNYGECINMDFAPKGTTWSEVYGDYKNGTKKLKLTTQSYLAALKPHTHPGYPWFPLLAPDVYRANLFIEELQAYEKTGDLPNFIILTLPCNHTEGTRPGYPTPRAMVADNDLALGRIVEAVSKSKFWPDTCIFVVEDDPQNGYDHVDAHRTVALAISPYTKRHFVDHTNYNQTGMVKTIELSLGLPPMNQLDLSATPMRNCFQAAPDLTAYTSRPNRIPLDEMNPAVEKLQGQALHWARKSLAMNLDEGDKADEDTLNRILWYAMRADKVPYPEQFAGKKDASRDASP
jgi:YVTN family beta-propeller protein